MSNLAQHERHREQVRREIQRKKRQVRVNRGLARLDKLNAHLHKKNRTMAQRAFNDLNDKLHASSRSTLEQMRARHDSPSS